MKTTKNYIRPSSLKNVEICSDFEQDETRELHPVTEAGTRLHKAMELSNPAGLEEEEIWLYESACASQDKLITEYFEEPAGDVYKELVFEDADGNYLGTTDLLLMDKNGNGLEIDYKFGFNKVDHPKNNVQFQRYVVLTFEKFPDLQKLRVAVIGPRFGTAHHDYTRKDIEDLKTRHEMIQARAGQGFRNASATCQYCKHIGTCEEVHKKFANADHWGELVPEVRTGMDMTCPKDLAKALEVKPLFEKFYKNWSATVTKCAMELLDQGYEIPGFEAKTRKGRTEVTDIPATLDAAELLGVNQEELNSCLELPLSGLIKLVREKAPKGKKGAWEEKFRESIAEFTKSGDPTTYIGRVR